MNDQKYTHYTTEDFLNDPDFISAVKYQDPVKEEFWNTLIAEQTVNTTVWLEARQQLEVILCAEQVLPPAGFIASLELDIKNTIRSQTQIWIVNLRRIMAAVSAAAVLLIGITFYWFYNSQITITSKYGQTLRIKLPDGTHIVLNSASSISYPRAMGYGSARKIQMEGEVFFDVVHLNHDPHHIKPSELFTVQTRQLDIQVLGTKFNVKERRGYTSVYLVKGKVRVTGKRVQQVLKPDELLTYGSGAYHKALVLPQSPVSWMSHKMVIHNISLKEVLDNFEDVFGKKIIMQDTSLYHKAIDGTILMENEKNTLFILSTITNTRVTTHGNTFYLNSAN